MSLPPATTGRLRRTTVRGLRALRDTHDDMVYLWDKSLTLPQAPPRPRALAGHAQQPAPARPPAVTGS